MSSYKNSNIFKKEKRNMTQEELKETLKYSVSTLFTFFNLPYKTKQNIIHNLKNVYSFNIDDVDERGNISEDYLYFLFNYDDRVDDLLDKINYLDKVYMDDYIMLKVDKWEYMSKEEWTHMQNSEYNKFKDIIYVNSLRDNRGTLQYAIITEDYRLKDMISKYCDIDVKDVKICWKAFDYDEEVLDLSKIVDMTILTYKKSWIMEQLDKANSSEKLIYQKILDNSTELTSSLEISVGKSEEECNFEKIHFNLQNRLKELTGKSQMRKEIKGTMYSLLPNIKDFSQKLRQCIKKYKITDFDKMEKCLIKHIETLDFPILNYYILKDGVSKLVTDMENYEEEVSYVKPEINTKDYF